MNVTRYTTDPVHAARTLVHQGWMVGRSYIPRCYSTHVSNAQNRVRSTRTLDPANWVITKAMVNCRACALLHDMAQEEQKKMEAELLAFHTPIGPRV